MRGDNEESRRHRRQIDGQDGDDNYYQEVNDTNTDPVSPIATGRFEEGVNQG